MRYADQASGEDVPPGIEFWNQDSVPEINVRVVGFDCLRGAHDQVPVSSELSSRVHRRSVCLNVRSSVERREAKRLVGTSSPSTV